MTPAEKGSQADDRAIKRCTEELKLAQEQLCCGSGPEQIQQMATALTLSICELPRGDEILERIGQKSGVIMKAVQAAVIAEGGHLEKVASVVST